MARFGWRGAIVLALGFAAGSGACSQDKIALSVDLRTDYVPGREFVNVVTEVTPDGEGAQSATQAVAEGQGGFVAGTRVADFGDLPPGSFQVKVRVYSVEGEPLVERLARLSVSSNYALTMVVTRNCEGVVCPEPAGDPNKNTCNGGKCVQPDCLPERLDLCPAPDCAADADCHADAPCVTAHCLSGTCLFVPDDAKCKAGESCDVTRGCFSTSGENCKATSATELNCGDGLDEDCDGKVDCLDPDCDTKACEDGDQCTSGESCQKSACSGGTAVTCDDANDCSDDACDHKLGCVHTPKTSGACDDGNDCTEGDHCEAGKCTAASAASCDDKNPCTDDTCDVNGCKHTPNTSPCDDGNACTQNDVCASGVCKPGHAISCDDKNPCTEDTCDPKAGCSSKNKAGPCEDGIFCNGADTCLDGACKTHAGPPCAQSCDESKKQCVGCVIDSDCGPVSQSPWSDCGGFGSDCATEGMQTSTLTSPKCNAGVCSNVVTTETQACLRATEGLACGDVVLGAWTACDYTDICDNNATQSRQVTTPTCGAGICNPAVTTESMACVRNNAGMKCGEPVTGAWSACGSFATKCDTSGSKTHEITSYACAADGTCASKKTSASTGCTRTVSNGTGCGSGKYCCTGSCVAKNDQNNCSSCGISCNGGKCVSAGGGQYSCTCGSNSQCVGDGFGAGATCWSASGSNTLCNCQCTGNNCCSGGADCYQPSGQNYCSY